MTIVRVKTEGLQHITIAELMITRVEADLKVDTSKRMMTQRMKGEVIDTEATQVMTTERSPREKDKGREAGVAVGRIAESITDISRPAKASTGLQRLRRRTTTEGETRTRDELINHLSSPRQGSSSRPLTVTRIEARKVTRRKAAQGTETTGTIAEIITETATGSAGVILITRKAASMAAKMMTGTEIAIEKMVSVKTNDALNKNINTLTIFVLFHSYI